MKSLLVKITLFNLFLALNANAIESPISATDELQHLYIISLDKPGLVHYSGDVSGYNATSPLKLGTKKLDTKSADSLAYLSYLRNDLAAVKSSFHSQLSRKLTTKFDYLFANYGFATKLTAQEANILRGMPGVKSVIKDVQYELDTDAGPTFIGADTLWSGSAMPANVPNQGEGVVVGVLDTGLNMTHPSFSDVSEDGYDFAAANPLGAGNFVPGSACNATFVCNNKHIGAWDFADDGTETDGPEDSNGHGSHTASTAVGNKISAPPGGFVTTTGQTLGAQSISGVAPHAHLINYDVCTEGCSGAAITAAINQAIDDQVDVISYSISGGTFPWGDSDRLYLDAVAAGIVVSASAGNTRENTPDPVGEVNHLGPWLLSVANSSHNRANSNPVSITRPTPFPASLTNMYGLLGVANNFNGPVNADLLYAGNVQAGNQEGCTAYTDSNAFTGKIALIIRGSCSFASKIDNAAAAGAIAAIIYNGVSDVPIVMGGIESTTIPAVMIGLADGNAIVAFINSVVATDVGAFISAATVYSLIDSLGNILNTSSLRGPNTSFSVTKPDINGPGTNIFAAYRNLGAADEYAFLTGTSMSAPHVAGAAALMIAAHPTWSPSEIKSAMMMTADKVISDSLSGTEEAANADDVGSGTADLSKSAISALVMNETFANYLAADPANGGSPETLNIPSLRSNACAGSCSWTRTVTNKSATTLTWNTSPVKLSDEALIVVSPSTFTLNQNQSQVITIDYNACAGANLNTMYFNDVVLNANSATVPASRITVSVNPTSVGNCTLPANLDLIYSDGFE